MTSSQPFGPLRRIARTMNDVKEDLLHTVLSSDRLRERGLRREVSFWDEWLASRGSAWPSDFKARFDQKHSLRDAEVVRAIDTLDLDTVKILDVGAGPLTYLAGSHPRSKLEITAVDPLGSEYRELFTKHGITPPIATETCGAEHLLERFSPCSFDITYARNSLDHAVNAPLSIIAMFEVTRPGGWTILRHHPSEGKNRKYRDLHRWDFDLTRDGVTVRDSHVTLPLDRLFAHRASIEWRHEVESDGDAAAEWIVYALRKRPVNSA